MASQPVKLQAGILLFENFELLDVFGPAQILGMLKSKIDLRLIALHQGHVSSAQGPRALADQTASNTQRLDILIVPGGMGTRTEVDNVDLIQWMQSIAPSVGYMVSVCTGSALLAKAGILDGKRATSNKSALEWVASQGPNVEWVKQARWVVDGDIWTSSGVSAGIDMTLALVEALYGSKLSKVLSDAIEYDRHTDSDWDPFSALYD